MKIGYARVSTLEQSTLRQEELLQTLGVDRVFVEKAAGHTVKRHQLQAMMSFVREGDTVVVESISRFARNTRDLLELVDELNQKNVVFISLKESIDTRTPTGQFMLTVFGAVAQLERDYLLQRQREGIELAKQEGKYKGRKPIPVDPEKFREIYNRWKLGEITGVQAQKKLGLTPCTFYRRVKQYEADRHAAGGGLENQ